MRIARLETARFWISHAGSPVKLSLGADARPVEYATGGRTEEGWHAEGARYWFEPADRAVYCEWYDDGADCDGRMSRHGLARCPVARLSARWIGECRRCGRSVSYTRGEGLPRCIWCDDAAGPPGAFKWTERYPDWEPVEQGQQDYSAEAAGY